MIQSEVIYAKSRENLQQKINDFLIHNEVNEVVSVSSHFEITSIQHRPDAHSDWNQVNGRHVITIIHNS